MSAVESEQRVEGGGSLLYSRSEIRPRNRFGIKVKGKGPYT